MIINKYGVMTVEGAVPVYRGQVRGVEIPILRDRHRTFNVADFWYADATCASGIFVTTFRGWDKAPNAMYIAVYWHGEQVWVRRLAASGWQCEEAPNSMAGFVIRDLPPRIEDIQATLDEAERIYQEASNG